MTTARTIISLALEGMNKLAPGETLDADLAAVCLRRLNAIADDWSTGRDMAPQDVIASGAVTGTSLTLGTAPFAAITVGEQIISAQADGYPMTPITMQQYNDIRLKTQAGRPEVYAWDGLATVYLYPAASGNTINLLTRAPFASFVDLDTSYTLPSGYQGAFAASLAVAMAPVLLASGVTPSLLLAEKRALFNVGNANVRPAIVSASPLSPRASGANILTGWNR
jgi:hypothetical protein